MSRSIVAAMCVVVAVLAPAASAAPDEPVRSTYIVVLTDDVSSARVPEHAQELARAHEGLVGHVYQHALKGFSVELTRGHAIALARNPRVASVEPDQAVEAFATQSPATWGLDRIDQRDLPLSNAFTYNQTGQGVHMYVIDTGVLGSHQEFAGRMSNGYNAINDGRGTTDCNGHGTHVAGTTGGTTYGVAKQVTIHPSACSAATARARTQASSRASTGSRRTTSNRLSRT
jgi:subtilisin family serine protease